MDKLNGEGELILWKMPLPLFSSSPMDSSRAVILISKFISVACNPNNYIEINNTHTHTHTQHNFIVFNSGINYTNLK